MAVATIDLAFDDDLIEQIDNIANSASITRNQLISNSIKAYINDRQRLQELFAYGKDIADRKKITEEDVLEEIDRFRKNK